jgi:hypothetical protein
MEWLPEDSPIRPYKRQYRKNDKHNTVMHSKLERDLLTHNWTDIYDEPLYEEAQAIFYERCRQYGVKTKYSYIK